MKELEEQGKTSVKANQDKINTLIDDSEYCSNSNQELEVKVSDLTKEQEKLSGSSQKLLKLNNLKGKITQKVSTITKEHKFFSENVTCPTCTQTIEESFRLNRINDVQSKAKDLNKGLKELEETIESEREENVSSQTIKGDY